METSRTKATGNRDNEIVTSWEGLDRIARKIAMRYWKSFFPTLEDLDQSAALAALAAWRQCGEKPTLKEAMPVIQKYLNKQAQEYGSRFYSTRNPDGTYTTTKMPRCEIPMSLLLQGIKVQGWDKDEKEEQVGYLEMRAMVVGIGQFTYFQARCQSRLFERMDKGEIEAEVRAKRVRCSYQQRRARDFALIELDLVKLVRAYKRATTPEEQTGAAIAKIYGWSKDKGADLLNEARRRGLLSEMLPNPRLLQVVEAYKMANSPQERTERAIAQKCGMAHGSVFKLLRKAEEEGLLPSLPKRNPQETLRRVVEAYNSASPLERTNRGIARKLGMAEKHVRTLLNKARTEGVLAPILNSAA